MVAGAAIPDRLRLQVKQHSRNWIEEARLWAFVVGLPSTKKSPILRAAAAPLIRIDYRLYRAYLKAKEEYDELDAKERKGRKPPRKHRLRIEDTTIEGASEVLRDSPGGVLCLQDELSGWFGGMDKYAGPRGASKDRGFWLQSLERRRVRRRPYQSRIIPHPPTSAFRYLAASSPMPSGGSWAIPSMTA